MNASSRLRSAGPAVVALALATGAVLAAAPKVDITVHAQKEVVTVDASGKRSVTLAEAKDAASGDVLVYTLRAANNGTGPAVNPRIEDPIPEGTVLMLESLKKTAYGIEASLDHGKSWQTFPASVTRVGANGSSETVPAPPESYTTLRFVLDGPLAPGDGRDVTFKVQIR
jgi:uncharacterized repeat protein (TIGR01451 family)